MEVKKSGLILSGGGARAAYQVGVLKAIHKILPKGHYNPFDVISGTSAGAINGVALAGTPRPNLVLAGAHTETEADIWSIEGAVESGRRAARVFEPDVVVLKQHKPLPLRLTARLDDVLYALGLPHVLSVLGAGAAAGLVLGLSRAGEGRRIR